MIKTEIIYFSIYKITQIYSMIIFFLTFFNTKKETLKSLVYLNGIKSSFTTGKKEIHLEYFIKNDTEK